MRDIQKPTVDGKCYTVAGRGERACSSGTGGLLVRAAVAVLVAVGIGCGVNEVVVEITGGDGNKVRLDAGQLEFRNNRLVDAGTFTFEQVKRGDYTVSVVGTGYMEAETLHIESAPISGVARQTLNFDLPKGSNLSPQIAGTIVFASSPIQVRDWDLFSIQADGSGLKQLTDSDENAQHPSWSPDGARILFTHGSVVSNLDIYVMDADGSNITRLTEHPERDQRATWSPDGSQIAFVSQRDGSVAIWLMEANGDGVRKLVDGREPSWSPDGARLAFTSSQLAGNDEIYLIDVDGSNRRRITDQKRFDWFPVWSPDGGRLAFNSERAGGQELMIASVNSGRQARITIAEQTLEQDAQWSPDGRALVYQGKMNFREDGQLDASLNQRTGKYRMEGSFDIFVVDAVGFDWDDTDDHPIMPVNLTNTADRDEASPSWRPYSARD